MAKDYNTRATTGLLDSYAHGEGGAVAEVEKGVEHGSIAPRRKWTKPVLAEGFRPSLPHLSRFLEKGLFIAPLHVDQSRIDSFSLSLILKSMF